MTNNASVALWGLFLIFGLWITWIMCKMFYHGIRDWIEEELELRAERKAKGDSA